MEYRGRNNGWQTFFEHYGMFLMALLGILAERLLLFFFNLRGQSWIYFFIASQVLLIGGAGLIVYAKLPAYRSGRFFTFGIKSVPQRLAGYYLWGWRVFAFGIGLSLCLALSRQ